MVELGPSPGAVGGVFRVQGIGHTDAFQCELPTGAGFLKSFFFYSLGVPSQLWLQNNLLIYSLTVALKFRAGSRSTASVFDSEEPRFMNPSLA